MNEEIKNIIDLSQKMIAHFIGREKKPSDFGTGELLYRFEIHVIDLIGKNSGININGLAEMMLVTKGAISQVVTKLLAKGYVNKIRDPENRRRIMLSLTAKGKIVYEKHNMFHNNLNAGIVKKLQNCSPSELLIIKNMLLIMDEPFDK
jgi:DNA-binding MarR family transcriptional regulator